MYSLSDFDGLRLHDVYLSRHACQFAQHDSRKHMHASRQLPKKYSKDTMSLGPGRLKGLQASHASSCKINAGASVHKSIYHAYDASCRSDTITHMQVLIIM